MLKWSPNPGILEEENEKLNTNQSWAGVGYTFKSEFIFYETTENSNRKMSQEVNIHSIMEPVVQP